MQYIIRINHTKEDVNFKSFMESVKTRYINLIEMYPERIEIINEEKMFLFIRYHFHNLNRNDHNYHMTRSNTDANTYDIPNLLKEQCPSGENLQMNLSNRCAKLYVDILIKMYKENQEKLKTYEDEKLQYKLNKEKHINAQIENTIKQYPQLIKESSVDFIKDATTKQIHEGVDLMIEQMQPPKMVINCQNYACMTLTKHSYKSEEKQYFKYKLESQELQDITSHVIKRELNKLAEESKFYQKFLTQKLFKEKLIPQLFSIYNNAIKSNPHDINTYSKEEFEPELLKNITVKRKFHKNKFADFDLLEVDDDGFEEELQQANQTLIKEFNSNTDFITQSLESNQAIKKFVEETFKIDTHPYTKYGYELNISECYYFVLNSLCSYYGLEKNITFTNNEHKKIYVIELDAEPHQVYILSLTKLYYNSKMDEFQDKYNQSDDPHIVIEREKDNQIKEEKEQVRELQGLESSLKHYIDENESINDKHAPLSYEIFIYSQRYFNENRELINHQLAKNEDIPLTRFLIKFTDMYEKFHNPNIIVNESYKGEYQRANCLLENVSYPDKYKYLNTFYGTQVFRVDGKLKLKISHNAKRESHLSIDAIKERISEVYTFCDVYDFGESFDKENTINVTQNKYSPPVYAEFYQDKISGETVENRYKHPMPNTSQNTHSFPTIEKALKEMFQGNDADIDKHHLILAKHIRMKMHSDFMVVYVTDSTLGEATQQYIESVIKGLYLAENCKEIDGMDLYAPIKGVFDDCLLSYINDIPTALTAKDIRSIKNNFRVIESTLKDYNLIIIKTTEVASLDLRKNPNNYCIFDIKNDFSESNYLGFKNSMKMRKGLREEVPAYLNYLNSLDISGSIEVTDNEFTRNLSTRGNRVRFHGEAWMKRDIKLFESLHLSSEDKDVSLLLDVKKCFAHKRPHVSQFLMISVFIAMEKSSLQRADIIASFKAEFPIFFNTKLNSTKQENSDEFYWLNSPHNEFYKGIEFDKGIKNK